MNTQLKKWAISLITSYFSSVNEKRSKHLKKDDNLMKDFENSCKTDEVKPRISSRKNVNPGTFLNWQKQIPWLKILNNSLMIWGVCKDFVKPEESSFVNGSSDFKLETLNNLFFNILSIFSYFSCFYKF